MRQKYHIFQHLILFLAISISIQQQSNLKISALNLLFPISNYQNVLYDLEAYNGCYEFSSSNNKVIQINNNYKDSQQCQNKVQLQINTRENNQITRQIIQITASEKQSNIKLKCEARISDIKQLQILTKLKRIDSGNYETIELIGFDQYGNSFSSLQGLIFNWKIEQKEKIAEIVTFKESGFKSTQIRQQIEDQGQQSDQIIIKTYKAGQIKLLVSYKLNQQIVNAEVIIQVVDNIVPLVDQIIQLPCSNHSIKLFKLKKINNQYIKENLEFTNNYQIEIKNKEQGISFKNNLLQFNKNLGANEIIIKDKENAAQQIQISSFITMPSKQNILFSKFLQNNTDYKQIIQNILKEKEKLESDQQEIIEFYNVNSLIQNKVYIAKVEIKDEYDKVINITNENIKFITDDKQIELLYQQNEFIAFKVLNQDIVKIQATIDKQQCIKQLIMVDVELNAYQQLKIVIPRNDKNQIFLPSLSQTKQSQQLQLYSIGGNEQFDCYSSDKNIAEILNNKIYVKGDGKAEITCQSTKDNTNQDKFILFVTQLNNLNSIFEIQEELINQKVNVPYSASYLNNYYANCNELNPIIFINETNDKITINNNLQLMNEYMRQLKINNLEINQKYQIKSLTEEYYKEYLKDPEQKKKLNQILRQFDYFGICFLGQYTFSQQNKYKLTPVINNKKYSISQLGIYDNIQIKYDEFYNKNIFNSIPLIALNSKLNGQIINGPMQWNNKQQPQIQFTTNKDNEKQQIVNITLKQNQLEIQCLENQDQIQQKKEQEEIIIELQIQNLKDKQLLKPLKMSLEFKVICGIPKTTKLFLINNRMNEFKQVMDNYKNNLNLNTNQQYIFIDWQFNSFQQPYWVFSSFKGNSKQLEMNSNVKINEYYIDQNKDNIKLNSLNMYKYCGSNFYQLDIGEKSMNFKIINKIKQNINYSQFKFNDDTITIQANQNFKLEPEQQQLLIFENITSQINIFDGSGHFTVENLSRDLIQIHQLNNRTIQVQPLQIGQAKIQVTDKELNNYQQISTIDIISIDTVQIKADEEIFQENKQTNVNIIIDQKLFEQIKNQNIYLSVEPLQGIQQQFVNDHFIIKGIQEGIYTLQLMLNNQKVGNQVEIEVFKQIYTDQQNILLMPNCKGFIKLLGGPRNMFTEQFQFQFTDKPNQLQQYNQKIFEINSSSMENQSEQIIQLINNKNNKVISEAKIQINVKNPNGIIIKGNKNIIINSYNIYQAFPTYDHQLFNQSQCQQETSIKIAKGYENGRSYEFTVQNNQAYYGQILLQGIKEGQILLEAQYKNNLNQYKDTYNVQIIKNYELPTLQLYHQQKCESDFFASNNLIIPPNNSFSFQSDLILQKITSNNSISINDNTVTSYNNIGSDLIQVQHPDFNLSQYIYMSVVKPSSLIIENMEQTIQIHPNETYHMKISYLDEYGRIFPGPLKVFNIQAFNTNKQVSDISFNKENQELVLKTYQEGTSTIYIQSLDYPELQIYLQINVGILIKPQGPLYVPIGSKIQFESVYENDNNSRNQWLTNDNNIIKLINKKGEAQAIQEGQTSIIYNQGIMPRVDVNVGKIGSFILSNDKLTMSADKKNQYYQDEYLIDFKPIINPFNQELQIIKNIDNQLIFQCKTNINEIEARYISNADHPFACLLKLNQQPKQIINEIKLTIISKSLYNSKIKYEQQFYLGFDTDIKQYIKNQTIKLDKNQNTYTIMLNSQKELQVDSSYELSNYIQKNFDQQKQLQTIKIFIPNSQNNSIDGYINILQNDNQSKQTIKVQYNPRNYGMHLFKITFNFNYSIYTLFFGTLLVIFVMIYIRECNLSRNPYWQNGRVQQLQNSTYSHINQ